MTPTTLSIIIPTYNEVHTIVPILERVCQVSWGCNTEIQIIVVDDGSTDHSYSVLQTFVASHPQINIQLLRHTHNQGKGAAIRTALPKAIGNYIVIQDADEEYNPSDLALMLQFIKERNLQAVYGSRYLGGGRRDRSLYPLFYYGVRMLSIATNLIYHQNITDEATCYKMFQAPLLRSLHLKCDGFDFCPEVTALVSLRGIHIEEIPIHYYPRSISDGKKIRVRHGLKAFWILIKYRLFSHYTSH